MSQEEDSTTVNGGETLDEKFRRGRRLVEESSNVEAVALLETVQLDIQARGLFSSNETMDDISTKSLPFLAIDHFLALAMVGLPVDPNKMVERKEIILKSIDLWSNFMMKLEQLELLSKDEVKEYNALVEDMGDDSTMTTTGFRLPPPTNRDAKIARFKAKQGLKKDMERLVALRERRQRCNIPIEEEMDGYDDEGLERNLYVQDLYLQKVEALEQWSQTKQELPMIQMMVERGQDTKQIQRHIEKDGGTSTFDERHRSRPLSTTKPMEVTRITKDSHGQLQIKREEIRSTVFRPGWNLPTMSLEELGEREYQDAMERDARQKEAEANRKNDPRKYEDLVRDGLEDDPDLVDASAKLDRDWDDFKDANPRGCGNKHANRGDKNF